MAQVLGTLAGALVLQRALELTFKKFPVLTALTTNLSGEGVLFNQTVYAQILAVPLVTDFTAAVGELQIADAPVVINQFKKVDFALTPQEYTATNRNLIDEQAEPIAVAIGAHMVGAIAALWTAANFPTGAVTAAVADASYATVVANRKALNDNGAPAMGRFHVVNGAVYEKYLTDPLIIQAYNNRDPQNPVVDGEIRGVAGFTVYEYPDLPVAANLTGFSGTKGSTIYAARLPKNPQELAPGLTFPGQLRTVTEPNSGMSVLLSTWIEPSTLKVFHRACWMYGVAKGDPKQGVIMKSA